jgi:hypothetical protein
MRMFWVMAAIPALLAAQDAREIVRRSVEQDQKNAALARSYTFLQRQEERQLDSSGKVKETNSHTWDVTLLEGSQYRRLVAHDDKPLSAEEQKKEDDRLRYAGEQRRAETPQQRERRLADAKRREERQTEITREVPDAFDFKLVGEESLNGGQAWVIDATPRPGYKPKNSAMSYFRKMKGRMWIDKTDYRWIKVEAETLDTITFGGFLVRMAKGGRIALEQERVNNEVWLPKRIEGAGSIRIALVKVLRGQLIITYSGYRKFSAESRVLPAEQ